MMEKRLSETMPQRLQHLRQRARDEKKENKKYFEKLAKRKPRELDATAAALHEEVFEHTDCLQCANCCKTASPIFRDKDIERIAGHFRMRPGDFVEKHLHIDEEGDYVLNQQPCPFLGSGNYCSIYDIRPKACREYPHTNNLEFSQNINVHAANSMYCPAVFHILERMMKNFPIG